MVSTLSKTKAHVRTILVVDDEPDQVMVTTWFLTRNGYKVITASDGLECIMKADRELPDLILLDNKMPHMDGLTALANLAISERTQDIPVVMVTASSDETNVARARNAGAVEYVVKPFDYTLLLERIAQALKATPKTMSGRSL